MNFAAAVAVVINQISWFEFFKLIHHQKRVSIVAEIK